MKELYTIKQGTKESVKHFDTCIGYMMMRLAAQPFHMPCPWSGQRKPGRPTSLAGYVLTSSHPWPGKCGLDGGGWQLTYEEIKDAARWVEQREDCTMSDDPFIRENATPTL